MGTKYSSVTVSGYNSSAPADDGSQTATNQVTWAKSKTKLGDPLKTAIEAINSALVTAVDTSVRAVTSNDTTTAADHLKTIQCTTNSAGFTVSLGDAATMAAGYIVTVANSGASTGDVTVAVISASDHINNVTNGTRIIPAGSSLAFVIASPARGYNVIGSHNLLKSPFWAEVSGVLRRITAPAYPITLGNVPAGVIMDYGGATVPTGWLECDGSAVSRTTYADLFTALGTVWGTGDTSTTFNIPDFKGRTRIGKGTGSGLTARALAASGGEESHVMTLSELVGHTHTVPLGNTDGAGALAQQVTAASGNNATTSSVGSATAFNVMQPYKAVMSIIKY